MSESTTWYAVYSSNAFSTIFMGEEEVQEALQVYPEAQVESFTSFDEACVWLESAQIPAKIEPSDDKSLVGCSRTEKGKPHEDSPYKRPLGSGSQTHRGGRNPRHSKTPTRPKRSPSTANSSPMDIFGVRPTTKSEPLDPSSCESSDAAGILTSGPSRLQNVEKEVKSDYYVNRELESSYVDTPITHDPAQHDCARVTLSSEQRRVLDMVLDGQSVFFTGSAGTGKSVLLREIIEALHVRGENVAVTASTGIAAINIGGKTLHSFAGVGLGNQNTKNLIEKARNKRTTKRWRRTKVLIIDEVSMVDARWFDVLNEIGQATRGDNEPFGGLQLVVCGDFFQLPPVPEQAYADVGIPISFAFEAKCWKQAVPTTITLTKVFRQKQSELVDMLNDMRLGLVSEASSKLFLSLDRTVEYNDGILPTEIFPLRRLADAANKRQMDLLKGEQIAFKAQDVFGEDLYGKPITPERGIPLLDRKVTTRIELRVGAQVMCIQNLPESHIVNGSIGVLIQFATPHEARSSNEGISIPNPDSKRKSGDRASLQSSQWDGRRWPVVKYQDGSKVLMVPFEFTHENADGGVEASRMQVPLILAWALTAHKAQGQTLERVKVDLEGTFEKGQAYVALSRCTTLEGLEVRNFSPGFVFAHPKVIDWARTLSVISDEEPGESAC